jgi:hypothetical protein
MVTLAGAASLAVRELLTGPPRAGRVVAAFRTCVYADLDGSLVAVEAHGGLRLPCAVVLAAPPPAAGLLAVPVGAPAEAGDGVLSVGPLEVRVARWWAAASPRAARPRGDVPASEGWERFARALLGLGPGLTPAGDDLLAGLLLGLADRPALRDPLAAAVLRHAPTRTTWLSAQLLEHAADGRGAPAAVAVADALRGHGPDEAMAPAVRRLLAVGHTTGAALARGLHLAASLSAPRKAAA